MKTKNRHTKSRFIRMGCAAMCLFYVIGLFNGLVLETLHEVSHAFTKKTHHHGFASDHETIDYSSLEAMAGHSHEALEVLKDLLEANRPHEQESKDEISFKLDKHLAEKTGATPETPITLPVGIRNWAYQNLTSFWFQSVTTPPPQFS
ncbi:hypothetical protein J0X14_18580 [Muricauda sp. CAU 1633]|uniref:hypothetical protein n=1 Tax=Allomuricauda sp. CAU 1633 TaxID=2816036 RepID=UPI001A8D8F18|nr:hypothetical protein [Muricauda sp. CAU 1633]MBO0324321.1 hypothetical protein [Muricauda sp. CAU 1633]